LLHSNIPYVVICQFNNDIHFLNDHDRDIARKFFDKASRVAFVSKHNLRLTERQLAIHLPHAIVVQNPVNLTELSRVDWPTTSTLKLATVARLHVYAKGQDVLFEALSDERWQSRDWQLSLYGSGYDDAYLKSLAQHYGITDRVEFCGHTPDVRAIWSAHHILVLPSRAEGTPLVLVEAMLAGRPAVVTDVGGNTEWVEEPVTGFIAEAATPRSLGSALERAWHARSRWELMGHTAHDVASARFDPAAGRSLLTRVLEAGLPGTIPPNGE
jgi:L-malate glycosyltransferase